MIYGQSVVTSNLTHCHMRCDNHCPNCSAEDETINHAIFEYPLLYRHVHPQQLQIRHKCSLARTTTQIWTIYSVERMILKTLSWINIHTHGLYGTFGKQKMIHYLKG